VKRLASLREPIREGYFPKLDNVIGNRTWPARHDYATLSDVHRDNYEMKFDISDLERWRDRLMDAINQKSYIDVS